MLTQEEIDRLRQLAQAQEGSWTIECLGEIIGRYLTRRKAVAEARRIESQTGEPATIHNQPE